MGCDYLLFVSYISTEDAPILYFCAINKIRMTAVQTAEVCATLDRSEVLAVCVRILLHDVLFVSDLHTIMLCPEVSKMKRLN